MAHYVVENLPKGATEAVTRIIEAANRAQAIAKVVEDTITVRVAEPEDFMRLAKAGGEIEKAG